MYGRSRVSVNVERGSTFTFTRDLSCIASISFTHINLRTQKLRDTGNQPYVYERKFYAGNKIEPMYGRPRVNVKIERGNVFALNLKLK